jgi:uncharacterized membrane protein YeiH
MHYPLLTQHLDQVARLADMAGVAVFAMSGALAAARKRLDIIAACFFALVTATGGGTVRDILIGAPVFWLTDSWPIIACVGVAAAVWIVPLQRWPAQTIEWLDAVGLVAYAVYGVSKALGYGLQPLQAATIGTLSACMGGVIRDIIAGVPSILLRHELYVTAAMLAAGLYVCGSLLGLSNPVAMGIGAVGGFTLRAAAIRYGLGMPPHSGS